MKAKTVVLASVVCASFYTSGCASTKSIFGVHPGVAANENGTTKTYDTEKLTFLDHGDSFWHQLALIKEGDSEFRPDLLAETFIDVAANEKRWVKLNEFEKKRAQQTIIDDLTAKKDDSLPKLENGLYVIEGRVSFYNYDFEDKSFRLNKVQVSPGNTLTDYSVPNDSGVRRDVNAYFQGSPTPPIIEPMQSMVFLNHTTYRATDRYLSRLSVPPYNVKFGLAESEAEKMKGFFSDTNLKVQIVSELVNHSDRRVRGRDSLVFEHNVLCYIFHNGKTAQIKYYENSEINNRSKEVCNIAVNKAFADIPLEQANIRPSFDAFPDDSITDSGKQVRSNLNRYF